MAETQTRTIVAIIIIVIIIVILIVVVVLVLREEKNFVPLGGVCTVTDQCVEGLVCDDGTCKVPLGGPCSNVSDCVNDATECLNGVCVVGSQPLPPNTCLINADCRAGEICEGSKIKVDGVDRFQFAGHQTVDVASFGPANQRDVIFLLDDGTLRRSNGTVIRSQLKLTAIFETGARFYGIHNGRVFRLRRTNPIWTWKQVKWSPSNIVYSNVSLNQEFLWLQVPRVADPKSIDPTAGFKGFLFQFRKSCRRPRLVRTEQLPLANIRVYGTDDRTFLTIDQITETGTLFKLGQFETITDIVNGAVTNSGSVLKITSTTCDEIYDIIILFTNRVYQLDRKFCGTAVTVSGDSVATVTTDSTAIDTGTITVDATTGTITTRSVNITAGMVSTATGDITAGRVTVSPYIAS